MRNRKLLACMAALGGLLLGACDDGGGGGTDGGDTHVDSGMTGVDGGGGGGTDGGGGGGTDGGGGGSDCAAYATAYCQRYMDCNPNGLIGAYQTVAICQRVETARCESAAVAPGSHGLTDEAACEATRTSDCSGFLSLAPVPDACIPVLGDLASGESCYMDAQCGTTTVSGTTRRMYCDKVTVGGVPTSGTAECPLGHCHASVLEGHACSLATQGMGQEFCDTYAGQYCVRQFDETVGLNPTDPTQCLMVTYGTAGDDCFDGTNMRCASGFECDSGSKSCMAALSEGQSCDPLHPLCDTRLNLSCMNEGTSGNHCRYNVVFVTVGAQCGSVTVDGRTENRDCGAYAYCDTTVTPSVCRAKVPKDGTCTVSPDNCEPMLECDSTSNTCQVPDPSSTCP